MYDAFTFDSYWKKYISKIKKEQKVVCGFPYACIENKSNRLLNYNELLWEH